MINVRLALALQRNAPACNRLFLLPSETLRICSVHEQSKPFVSGERNAIGVDG